MDISLVGDIIQPIMASVEADEKYSELRLDIAELHFVEPSQDFNLAILSQLVYILLPRQ